MSFRKARIIRVRLIYVGLLVFSIMGGGIRWGLFTRGAVPMSPEPVIINMGYTFPGATKELELPIKNEWNSALRIERISTSCGCTKVSVSQNVLPSGGKATLTARVETPLSGGTAATDISVDCLVGETSVVFRFKILVDAPSLISMDDDSYYLDMGEALLRGEPLTRVIHVHRGSNPVKWNTLTALTEGSGFRAVVKRIDDDDWDVVLTLSEFSEIGTLGYRFTLAFEDDGKKLDYHLIRRVTARVTGPIYAGPESLLLGILEPGQRVTRKVHIGATNGGRVEIDRVRSSSPDQIQYTTSYEDGDAVVTITYTASMQPGIHETDIFLGARIQTPDVYNVRISLLARVVQAQK